MSWKQVIGQFALTLGWYQVEYREKKKGINTENIVGYLGSSAFLWSPSIWYKRLATAPLVWAAAVGYVLGSSALIFISGKIWGKKGAADASEFVMGTADYGVLAGAPQDISMFYLTKWALGGYDMDPLVKETTYTQDQGWQNKMTREQELELGLISVDEYRAWFNREIKKMDEAKRLKDQWNGLTKSEQTNIIATRAAHQRQIAAMSW